MTRPVAVDAIEKQQKNRPMTVTAKIKCRSKLTREWEGVQRGRRAVLIGVINGTQNLDFPFIIFSITIFHLNRTRRRHEWEMKSVK